MNTLFKNCLEISLQISVLFLVLQTFRYFTKDKFRFKNQWVIYLILAVRLICPASLTFTVYKEVERTISSNTMTINQSSELLTSQIIDQSIVNSQINIYSILIQVWLLVAVGIVIYQCLSHLQLVSKIKRWKINLNANELDAFNAAKKEVALHSNIKLIKSSMTTSPLCYGVINSTIVIPDQELTYEQYKLIMVHELTHIKHHDLLIKLILLPIQAFYWFNPIILLLIHQIELESEIHVDEMMLKNHNETERLEYGRLLYHFIQQPTSGLSTSFSSKTAQRFKELVQPKPTKESFWLILSITLLTFIVGCSVKEKTIIVDSKSTDDTSEILDKDENVIATIDPDEQKWYEYLSNQNLDELNTTEYRLPVDNAKISCGYGCYEGHTATDMINEEDEYGNVYAIADGTVTEAAYNGINGHYILIDHGEGITSYYGHLNKSAYFSNGDTVVKGDIIGQIGMSGRVSGPHVHFVITIDGIRIDPMEIYK